MSQLSFSDAEFLGKRKQTRRELFLAEMEQVIPWQRLQEVIELFYPKAGKGRRPYALATMLRIHLMQNWFGYSDPAMEDGHPTGVRVDFPKIPTRRFAIGHIGPSRAAGRFVHPARNIRMPRPPRLDLPGVAQHVVQRGNDRQPCFFTADDHRR